MKDRPPPEPPDEGRGYRAACEAIEAGFNALAWFEGLMLGLETAGDVGDLDGFVIGARQRVAEALGRVS